MEGQHQLLRKGQVAFSNVDLRFEQNEEGRIILEDPEEFNKVDSLVLLNNRHKLNSLLNKGLWKGS